MTGAIAFKRHKPAKADTPQNTIARVREHVRGLGCCATIVDNTLPDALFFSCHLLLYRRGDKHPLFGCNGKGMTWDLALASAYGELAERLQNLVHYQETVYFSEPEHGGSKSAYSLGFQYAPDEVNLSTRELLDGELPAMRALFAAAEAGRAELIDYISRGLDWPYMRCVPYTSLATGNTHLMPVRLMHWIVGSNGMCAGNTVHEALIHGICEVLERVVLKTIYATPFTPPDIPSSMFDGQDIFERIKRLERALNVAVKIKDCSLGRGLPVVGVLLLSNDTNRYAFHLGAAPCPITALERCFTELFQGGPPRFHATTPVIGEEMVGMSPFWQQQWHSAISAYAGRWPAAIFSKGPPDYGFEKIDCFSARSDQEDLHRLVSLIGGMGLDPMIRYTGFLGLPTFYVYIPGMSEITNFFDNRFLEQLVRFEQALPYFYSMTALDAQAREALAERIDRFQFVAPSGEFKAGAYLRHCPDSSLTRVKGRELVTALRTNRFPFQPPPCFSCDRCDLPGCLYESMNGLWQGLKRNQARAHRCSIPHATGPEASLRPE